MVRGLTVLADGGALAQDTKSVWAGVYDARQAARGAGLYTRAEVSVTNLRVAPIGSRYWRPNSMATPRSVTLARHGAAGQSSDNSVHSVPRLPVAIQPFPRGASPMLNRTSDGWSLAAVRRPRLSSRISVVGFSTVVDADLNGQPSAHSQDRIASRVAVSHSRAAR